MSDMINNLNVMPINEQLLTNHNHLENVKAAGHAAKGRLVDHVHNKLSVQSNNVINQLLPNKQIGVDNTHCVGNINLLNNKISQLKCEISNKIWDAIAKYRLWKEQHGSSEESLKDERQDDLVVFMEKQVEAYVKLMLIKLQILLISAGSTQTFKIVTMYEICFSSLVAYKQMFTLIPYKSGHPQNSISEITQIDTQGSIRTINSPSRLIDGGFEYSGDWLYINVKKESINVDVQELNISFGQNILRGYSITSDLEMQQISKQLSHNMYISNIFDIW